MIRPLLFGVLLAATALPALSDAYAQEATSNGSVNLADEANWSTNDGRPVSESWEFADNEIRLIQPRGGKGSLISKPLPSNFELSWEWKIDSKANTGLKYRVRRFGKKLFNDALLGIEYQIIDDQPNSTDKGSTASVYDLVGTSNEKVLHPPGEWNSSKVIASGDRLQHFLNGKRTADVTTRGPGWDLCIAQSKFYGSSDFGRPGEDDRIMLTDHGGKAVYRNFQFTSIETPQPVEKLVNTGPFLANGFRNSWADQNSVVVWTRTTAHPEMNFDGKAFVSIGTRDASKLSKTTDSENILRSQLPDGAQLEDMLGACPGAAGRVRLHYFPGKQRSALKSTSWVDTKAESDFTAQWKIENLKPGTRYALIAEAQDESGNTTAVVRGSVLTAPRKNAAEKVRFCITTCHDFIRRDDGRNGHKIYPAMMAIKPDFVVHAGDIEYYDKPDPWAMTLELMRFKWGRIFALPNNRDFYRQTTSYFLKDDHDTLKNDCWAGQTYGSVTFEQGVKIFNEEQFPSLEPRYTSVRWGRDLEIWFLEGRDYRSPNNATDGPEKTILGEKQKQWLFESLEASDAPFKLVCSPTPVVGPDRKNKKDNHANTVFAHEGEEMRQRLSNIEGVIVLCGDRHWQYASKDAETGLWEFGCGPGSEKHGLGWNAGDKRPVHEFLRVKGGFLSGEISPNGKEKAATLTLRHHTVTGDEVSEFRFPTMDPEQAVQPDQANRSNPNDQPAKTVETLAK